MAVDIRYFINSHLLEPLKHYNTVIQDTMIEIIIEKLQLLYDYTYQYPEILSPSQSRLDILKVIADQFLFTVQADADLQEQVDILDHILYVYSKRGSIDTIENMWKYYGGNLPKDVEVIIPSYNIFRYSISRLSGTHVFQDNTINRTGVYEIKLTNNTYPIPDLRDFLIKELVAAGNYIYFTNALHMNILDNNEATNPYKYEIDTDTLLQIQMSALKNHQGFTWSGFEHLSGREITPPDSRLPDSSRVNTHWSGKGSIFLEVTRLLELQEDPLNFNTFIVDGYDLEMLILRDTNSTDVIKFNAAEVLSQTTNIIELYPYAYCTPSDTSLVLERHLYDSAGELVNSSYPGYFVLGETLLGEEIM